MPKSKFMSKTLMDMMRREIARQLKATGRTKVTKRQIKRTRLMTIAQKRSLIKAIGKNKSMKPSSRKAAIRKIKAKKTRKG